jgi:hypothetical protein
MLVITTNALPPGVNGVLYGGATMTASGGVTPYTWAIISGTLPAGLTLNATTGAISGAPTAASFVDLTIQVTDSDPTPAQATAVICLPVAPAVLKIGLQSDGGPIVAATIPTSAVTLMGQQVAQVRNGSGNRIYSDLSALVKSMLSREVQSLLSMYPPAAVVQAQAAMQAAITATVIS